MADKKPYDSDFVAYLNAQAKLFSEIDGTFYGHNDVEAIQKRLLEGGPAPKVVTKQPPAQATPAGPRPKSSILGFIVSGFDI